MAEDLPFRAEYAKSGRAGCKGCKETITKNDLRLAVMIQSPKFDGKIPNWFHFKCFFIRNRIKTTADVAHFESLRWEDQKRIKDKIGGNSDIKPGGGGKKEKKTANNKATDFSTEYAKSNRSTCRGCEQKIEKGVVRISKTDFDTPTSFGPTPMWYHIDCFVKNREMLEFYDAADTLPGFFTLGADDQKILKAKLKQIKEKRKPENKPESSPPKKQKLEDKKEESILQKQNQIIFKYRDLLEQNLSKKELQELLEFNNQQIPKGESNILDHLADCMAFGALEPCPECKDGQLKFSGSGYRCKGHVSGWTTCQYTSKTPKRKPFVIPEELLEYSFLKKYKGKVLERFLPSNPEEPSTSTAQLKKENSLIKPLENLTVVIVGKLNKPNKELTKTVEQLGGKVVSKVTENVICVITNEEEVKKNNKKIKDAEKANVHVVSEEFLDNVQKGGAALMISQHSLCSWGGDPTVKISQHERKTHTENMFTKSIPTKMKMTVKGGAAVDPDSGLDDVAHVYEHKGEIYNAVLGMVDIVKGTNSYYKLQILEGDKSHQFWVFRSWGRVGTTIGGNKLEEFDNKMDAVLEFKRLYEDKTGNMWEDRKNFVKHPNKFYPLDIDYGQDNDSEIKKLEPVANSKIPIPVQELICLIFDIEGMKRQMIEYELDLKKMPLGKLSKKQIEHAYSVLTELQELKNKEENQSKILDASNRFYTLIPHDFGLKKPPLLDNDAIIKSKLEMLESLLEIEVAYTLLKEAKGTQDIDPVTRHYNQLKTDVEVLEDSNKEYEIIEKYLKNTHAKTHDQYTLDLEQVFKISRHGEKKRFKPFKNLSNRYLLWHGSRITNYAGILSQGLRIAPPEAPVTGYMFGKGIYFADMVSKSANYCYTTRTNNVGILLLCEVALGNMYERTAADYITKLPPNMHSTKGCGKTVPDPDQVIKTDDGVIVPAGKPVKSQIKRGDLLYNEYIIYDTAQVNIKYLLKVRFNWK